MLESTRQYNIMGTVKSGKIQGCPACKLIARKAADSITMVHRKGITQPGKNMLSGRLNGLLPGNKIIEVAEIDILLVNTGTGCVKLIPQHIVTTNCQILIGTALAKIQW